MTDINSIDEQAKQGSRDLGKNGASKDAHRSIRRLYPYLVLAAFLIGMMTSYVIWGRGGPEPVTAAQGQPAAVASTPGNANLGNSEMTALIAQINPPGGYTLPANYGDLGPRLIEAGVIDFDAFAAIYADGGSPLSQDEANALQHGGDQKVTISAENSHFLLNFFWAVGLANKNSILTEGPMFTESGGQIDRFASTGGWGLGSKPVTEIYASIDLIPLTEEQQKRVEEVAAVVYRPCCNNPTIFPDCNHGMAMLGLLELMASQGASADEMFTAAKYVNAFWFPQQTLETAIYLKASQNTEYKDADARLVVRKEFSSGTGSSQVHQLLQAAGLLDQTPDQGSGCTN